MLLSRNACPSHTGRCNFFRNLCGILAFHLKKLHISQIEFHIRLDIIILPSPVQGSLDPLT